MSPQDLDASGHPASVPAPDHDAGRALDPSGQSAGAREIPDAAPVRRAVMAGLAPASKFLGRLAQLDLETLGRAIHAWHRVATDEATAWYEAEAAVADAVERTRRYAEQEMLLRHMATLFLSRIWFREAAPGARIRAAEPAGQYVATLSMLALLVRDGLHEQQFALLYAPFVDIIPLEQLERE